MLAQAMPKGAIEEGEPVNIDELEEFHDVSMRVRLARTIAEDTLDIVNRNSRPVKPRRSFYTKYGKRMIDIVLSGCALIITAPVNLALAVCTYFDVGSPIIFRQKRPGMDGRVFTIVKFRNMTNEKDASGNLLPANERVTKFGKFVRKTSLDELMNFWSVFKGDMSLIGPRPLALSYTDRFSERHRMRNAVRPGLECPILKRPDHKLTWAEQFENDVYYVENLSLGLDLKMVLALVGMVFNKKSTAMRGAAVRGSFMGYNADGTSVNSQRVPAKYVNAVLEAKRTDVEAAV